MIFFSLITIISMSPASPLRYFNMTIRASNRRTCGGFHEGFYPYQTFWPEYEYRCPNCKTWHKNCEISVVHEDNTESFLCEVCSAEIDALENIK